MSSVEAETAKYAGQKRKRVAFEDGADADADAQQPKPDRFRKLGGKQDGQGSAGRGVDYLDDTERGTEFVEEEGDDGECTRESDLRRGGCCARRRCWALSLPATGL